MQNKSDYNTRNLSTNKNHLLVVMLHDDPTTLLRQFFFSHAFFCELISSLK